MESKKLKLTKYLVLGESLRNAFHGVLLPKYLFLIILIFCSSCTLFSDSRIIVKPIPVVDNYRIWLDNYNRWMILAYQCEKHFDTTGWTTEEIAAELSLQEYYLESKSDPLRSGQGKW